MIDFSCNEHDMESEKLHKIIHQGENFNLNAKLLYQIIFYRISE